MADQETTTETSVETGAETAQPETADQSAAAQDDVTATTDDTVAGKEADKSDSKPSFDEDTLKWMNAKGIDPQAPDALAKATKAAREAEKAMHKKAGEKSQLERDMLSASDEIAEQNAQDSGQNPELVKRLQRMEVRESIREFWNNNPDAKEHENEIRDALIDKNISGDAGHMLEIGWALVQQNHAGELKAKGGKEALETLASKQRSTALKGAAVNPAPSAKTEDLFVKGFDEYKRN